MKWLNDLFNALFKKKEPADPVPTPQEIENDRLQKEIAEKLTLINELREQVTTLEQTVSSKDSEYEEIKEELETTTDELLKLVDMYRPSELENHCMKNFQTINNIAYKNKRKFKGKSISIYLNELITPKAWEVCNFRRSYASEADVMDAAWTVGNALAKELTWTDDGHIDKSGDYYLMPNETLVYKTVDCEDHAFALASLDSRFGVAYGFLEKNGSKYGHAWNIFVKDGVLYHLDTVANKAIIEKMSDKSNYELYYVITKTFTFKAKGGVHFGYLAKWTE